MIENKIAELITELCNLQKPLIISICGAADLGKTHISKEVTRLLNIENTSSAHLTLDSYLLDRDERKEKGLSGYQIESHNIELIQSDLGNWIEKGEINYRPYCHKTGTKEEVYKSIKSSKVLLIEGLFSMDKLLLPYIDYSIFIFTSDENLRLIKYEADITKRGYTKAYSEKIYNAEFELYKKNIEPFKNVADCKIMLLNKWNYILQEKEY